HELVTRLERQRPGRASAVPALGAALERLRAGDLAQAERLGRQALEAAPGDGEVLQVLGSALLRQGKAGEAAAAWEQAVQIRPDSAEAHFGLGQALVALGRREEAIRPYREAARLRPDYA